MTIKVVVLILLLFIVSLDIGKVSLLGLLAKIKV